MKVAWRTLGNARSVNKTRLKERLLEYFKEAQEQFDGRNTSLVFKEEMRNMIQDALKKRDFSEDALILARAASIIRILPGKAAGYDQIPMTVIKESILLVSEPLTHIINLSIQHEIGRAHV